MKKFLFGKTIYLGVFLLLTNILNAQLKKPGITLGGYLNYAAPQGDFKNAYNFGIGGELFGGAGWGKTFIIATAGFSAFKTQNHNPSGTLTYIPVKLGLREYIFKKILFINGDFGSAVVKNNNFNAPRFTRGIGFGAKLLGIEAALYYDGWKNKNAPGFSNSLNIKAGWNFSL